MKQRFGALLCLILGAVLIFSGVNGGGDASGGTTGPTACGGDPGAVGAVGNPGTCPTGTIKLSELTDNTANPDATSPATWAVAVSSVGGTCNLPSEGTTQNVADSDGPVSFTGLFIYPDTSTSTLCEYQLTETAVAGFAPSFTPAAPYSFIFVPSESGFGRNVPAASPIVVVLTNRAAPATTSAAPSTSAATSSSAPTSSSATVPSTAPVSTPSSASAAPILATTGPSRPVRGTLIAGIALCMLGFVLLFAGRRPRSARHG